MDIELYRGDHLVALLDPGCERPQQPKISRLVDEAVEQYRIPYESVVVKIPGREDGVYIDTEKSYTRRLSYMHSIR